MSDVMSKALQMIQSGMKDLQAELSAKKNGYKLPGMEDETEEAGEVEGTESEEGMEDGQMLSEDNVEGLEALKKGPMPGSGGRNIFGGEVENEDSEEEGEEASNEMKKSPKMMAIKALILKGKK